MTFLKHIIQPKRAKKAEQRGVIVDSLANYGGMSGDGIDYGLSVNNAAAMRITAVYSAIRIRSENIASLPKRVILHGAMGDENQASHPVAKIIRNKPNGYMNAVNFWTAMNASMDGWGNAFAIIERDAHGDPLALHPLMPSQVSVGIENRKKYYKVQGSALKMDGVYSDNEMCHFMQMSLNGLVGMNPIEYNATALAKGVAATKFGSEFYKKGGNIRAVLETDGSLDGESFTNFMRHYQDSATNYSTPLLEYGIKYKEIGISPVSAQLLDTETFSIQDIARIFNVPPHMLCEMSHATFSNIEHQNIYFVVYSLRPSVKRFEEEIESKLFFEGERDVLDVKFDLNGMMRGDSSSRAEWYRTSIQNGYMTRNEVRVLEGLPKLEGLDEPLYPGNMNLVGGDGDGGNGDDKDSDDGKGAKN